MSSEKSKRIVAFGETLWDCLPSGLFLGGAPLNVAYHAKRLGAESYIASSVGRDFLGDQSIQRVEEGGVRADLLKAHAFLPTGVAIAHLSESGDASYEIREPVAWDHINLDTSDRELIASADVLVYGTLAARSDANRQTLGELLTSHSGTKICDVNLRAPYDCPERALELASQCDILKLNDEELAVLCGSEDLELEYALARCQEKTGVETICLTLGKEGGALWENRTLSRFPSKEIKVADTIGAGDSFTAAFAVSMMEGRSMKECLSRAVTLGAFVASKSGAQPDYDPRDVFGA